MTYLLVPFKIIFCLKLVHYNIGIVNNILQLFHPALFLSFLSVFSEHNSIWQQCYFPLPFRLDDATEGFTVESD